MSLVIEKTIKDVNLLYLARQCVLRDIAAILQKPI